MLNSNKCGQSDFWSCFPSHLLPLAKALHSSSCSECCPAQKQLPVQKLASLLLNLPSNNSRLKVSEVLFFSFPKMTQNFTKLRSLNLMFWDFPAPSYISVAFEGQHNSESAVGYLVELETCCRVWGKKDICGLPYTLLSTSLSFSAHTSRLHERSRDAVRIGMEYMELADTYQTLLVKCSRHTERFLCVLLHGGSFALGDQDLTG